MAISGQHCTFVLLAEFDIDKGAQLTYQFPQPLGTDEGLLANLMLPDGAERQLEDWTIFFLNQAPFNIIAPVLALDGSENAESDSISNGQELLHVLNLVRTKHDKSVRRGAVVKALAICTRHPFIQIFKPILLLALDDYFANPSQDCLARLFDAINSMDISAAPTLTRAEKLVMRLSDRKDIFAEKFVERKIPTEKDIKRNLISHSNDSRSSLNGKERTRANSLASQKSSSETSFTLGGSAVWVGDESGLETVQDHIGSQRGRRSMDANSASSHSGTERKEQVSASTIASYSDPQLRSIGKDTHFFQTSVVYKGHTLPIRMPLSTFPEEIGDYSLIELIQTFSSPNLIVSGPQHPHLHTNGSLTHPVIILFNALLTEKKIIFLGYQRPAGMVSNYVLAACALGSGCGVVFRGFIARAFPYANLTNCEEWEKIPGYIAGVTNPIFETTGSWDLLCDIGTGRMMVHKDIYTTWPLTYSSPTPGAILPRSGIVKAEGSMSGEDELGRPSLQSREGQSGRTEIVAKADNADNIFIEDIVSAISYHFGESLVRARFVEYVYRFTRLTARYEEETFGFTGVGYHSAVFSESPSGQVELGSGITFTDDVTLSKELATNASRIEGWRRTESYEYFKEDFQHMISTSYMRDFDLVHQVWRLRNARNMSDVEVELILRTILENAQFYEQVVELLVCFPPHLGGLLPLSFGLFHQQEHIRDLTVDLLTILRAYPVGVQFLQSLNHLHRYAYVRQAHTREAKLARLRRRLQPPPKPPPAPITSRTPSNRSESSLGAG